MDRFKDKFRVESARLKDFDYSSNGMYFVTICTKDKIHYFGEIVETDNYPSHDSSSRQEDSSNAKPSAETDNYPSLRFSEIGKIANEYWQQIPLHFPFVELDEFVIMPNHIHGILLFKKDESSNFKANKFGTQSQNLGSVIRGFKSTLKRYANQNNIDFWWQARFHDHVIRNEETLQKIREYIRHNPANWLNDELF